MCHGRTLKCTLCTDYMARGGSNYDNKLCIQCDPFPSLAPSLIARARVFPSPKMTNGIFGSVNIESGISKPLNPSSSPSALAPSPAQHMANIIDHLSTPWSVEDAQLALKRESAFRAAARACGVLRPFLLLVSMSIVARVRVAAMMGISLITSHSFGDSHAESWIILHSPFLGMQWNRGGGGQMGSSATWYDILRAMQSFTQQVACTPLNAAASLSLAQCADDAMAELELSILSSLHMASLPHLTENVAQRAAVLRVVNEVIQAAGGDAIQSYVTQAGLPRVVLNALAVLAPLDARGDSQSSQEKLQVVALFHASVLHALQRKGMDVSVLDFEGMVASATDSVCQDILSSGQYTLFQDLWQDHSSSEAAAQGGVVLGALIGGPLAVAGVAWSAAQLLCNSLFSFY
jgi:hypothetical protein